MAIPETQLFIRYILQTVIGVIIVTGIWHGALIYIDCRKREIPNKGKWVMLGVLLGYLGFVIYVSATQRPQTQDSLSPAGILIKNKIKPGLGLNQKLLLGILLISGFLSLFQFIKSVLQSGLHETFISHDNGGVLNATVGIFVIIYAIIGFVYLGKLNPLDKPLWGMDNTPEGPIDNSLTKHKRTVVGLIILIVLVPVFTIIFLKFFASK